MIPMLILSPLPQRERKRKKEWLCTYITHYISWPCTLTVLLKFSNKVFDCHFANIFQLSFLLYNRKWEQPSLRQFKFITWIHDDLKSTFCSSSTCDLLYLNNQSCIKYIKLFAWLASEQKIEHRCYLDKKTHSVVWNKSFQCENPFAKCCFVTACKT